MERGHPYRTTRIAEELFDAGAHFLRGLVREGHREDFVWRRVSLADEVSDAERDHARLAGSGAGQNQQRTIGVHDCFALFRI